MPLQGDIVYDDFNERDDLVSVKDQLEIVAELIKMGKVRHFGLSNESPYGVGCFTCTADLLGLPRPVSLQKPYNLLERSDMVPNMQEACSAVNGNVALIAYSPLGGGALSGKYLPRVADAPDQARLKLFPGYMHRYVSPASQKAVKSYHEIAAQLEIPLATVALTWVASRPFITSTLLGVTNDEQLDENVRALNLVPLSEDLEEQMEALYAKHHEVTKGRFRVSDSSIEYDDPSKMAWGAKDQDVDPELNVIISQQIQQQ